MLPKNIHMSLFHVKKINYFQLFTCKFGSPLTFAPPCLTQQTIYRVNAFESKAVEEHQKETTRELPFIFPKLAMNPIILLLLLSLFTKVLEVEPAKPRVPGKARLPNSHITVMGFVYCDICSNNSFSRHSYFLPGAEVRIDCIFKALSAKTKEEITLSVNRTTNKYGMYKLEIPSVDGVKCAEDPDVASSCKASLMWSSSSSCNVPGYRSTSNEITVKARRDNLCIYSLIPLNYRPSKRDITLCGN